MEIVRSKENHFTSPEAGGGWMTRTSRITMILKSMLDSKNFKRYNREIFLALRLSCRVSGNEHLILVATKLTSDHLVFSSSNI
jgi:hypothetical protein